MRSAVRQLPDYLFLKQHQYFLTKLVGFHLLAPPLRGLAPALKINS